MIKQIHHLTTRHFVICLALTGISALGIGRASPVPADTILAEKEDYSDKDGWEHAVNLPGKLIYWPLSLLFKGTERGIAYVYDNKVIPRIYTLLTSADFKRGVRPVYSSRTGAGLKYFAREVWRPGVKFDLRASVGQNFRQAYSIGIRQWPLLEDRLLVRAQAEYINLSSEAFFGIGIISKESARSDFAHEQSSITVGLTPQIGGRFSMDIALGYEINNILPGRSNEHPPTRELYDATTLPGLQTGLKLAHATTTLGYDGTDNGGNPSRGTLASVTGSIYRQIGDEEAFGFSRIGVDLSRHLHLFYDRTLVLRLAAENIIALPDKTIPFYYLSELGEQETIRGFTRGRFRDEDLILGSAEYRFPLRQRKRRSSIGACLFVDAGKVTPDLFKNLNADDLELTYGLGIRLYNNKALITKLEAGFSSDGFRMMFKLD